LAWIVRLTDQAEQDLLDVALWTSENFGSRQAKEYLEGLMQAIEALYDGPEVLGAKKRDDIGADIRILHVALFRKKGRHFVVFRQIVPQTIDVLRLLHDSMDLARHVPEPKE
jgi:toxin ParE1/3/4